MQELRNNSIIETIKTVVSRFPAVAPHLTNRARLFAGLPVKATPDINREYNDAIIAAIVDYFEGGAVAASRNDFKRAMITAFGDSFDAGWQDGGGELPIDDDAMAWLEDRLNEEAGYIDGVFQEAKELRKDKEFDYFTWATQKAERYVNTLTSIYNAAKLLANDRQMLTWRYGDADHCATCEKLNGQRHRASWYIDRDYIPGKPGAAMDCGGYRCQCVLLDASGNEVTI